MLHDVAYCRPDLVEHEPGQTCTWPLTGDAELDKKHNRPGCYWDHEANRLRPLSLWNVGGAPHTERRITHIDKPEKKTHMSIPKSAAAALASIEALAQIRADGHTELLDVEREALSGWTGWGPIAKALDVVVAPEWLPVSERLDELLTEAELNAARDLVDTSFYTPKVVTDAVFQLLAASGFSGGRVLEPGCGIGAFMSQTPDSLDIDWTGIDRDPVATAIAKLLHPESDIITSRLERHFFVENSFDAVVGNVPFAHTSVHDPSSAATSSLHGYFIARSIEAVRPGGFIIVATSRYVIDGISAWKAPFDGADLISAVRLPSGTFDGTAVAADLIVLRKHDDNRPERWDIPTSVRESRSYYGSPVSTTVAATTELLPERGTENATVSALWAEHPDCVAGRMEATGYALAPLRVVGDDSLIPAAVAAAEAHIRRDEAPTGPRLDLLEDVILEDAEGRKERSFHVIDGKVHQVTNGRLAPVTRASKELSALIALRTAAVELLDLESDTSLPDDAIEPARVRALESYLDYMQKFGALGRGTLHEGKIDPETGTPALTWRRPTMGGFRRDPDYFVVLALESFDQETGEARPAPILRHRVNFAVRPATSADSIDEALSITLGERAGLVDAARIGELLSIGEDEARERLLRQQLAFADPATGELVEASRYLSGNVRQKLDAATELGADEAHVQALAAALPEQLGPLDIRPQLGAPWIAAEDHVAFGSEVLGISPWIAHEPTLATWSVDSCGSGSPEARASYATTRVDLGQMLDHGLNGKSPVVYDKVWNPGGGEKRVRNSTETLAAEDALTKMQARFSTWLWEDQERAERLCAEYNRRFRSHVPRRGDGAHLTFPGLSTGITLWPHQRAAVDRILSTDRIILNHPVGAGKTLESVVGAMKLRQLGLAQKPVIVVPNHLLEQIASEARGAYPAGRFLIAGKDELDASSRRLFAARCATGDWDAIVMTHSAFASIGISADAEQRWMDEQKAELRSTLAGLTDTRSKGAKRVASALRRLETSLDKARYGVADAGQITFEQLGVDHISVDELHLFRRLLVTTNSDSGFSLGHSKRATDLLMKVQYLAERKPGKPVFAGFTGTLLSNTLAEVFVWQTFTQPQRLLESGVNTFDAWAATFVKWVTAVEVKPEGGGFHTKRRPSAIQNAPELASMLSENCDSVTKEDINLEVPDFSIVNVTSIMSSQQREYLDALGRRAEDVRRGDVKPDEDNMLSICNEGRALALDPALIGVAGGSSSLEEAADNIAEIWAEHKNDRFPGSEIPGVFQMVFSDLGTPRPSDTQTYGRLRQMLVARGLPARSVRFVHEATTDKARAALFASCRSGEVAVLLGSTAKIGMGTNVQTRLIALHHLDAPWLPSSIAQRDGRGLRPHNLCSHVTVYRYVTEGTFDAMVWETLERKARFIAAFESASTSEREVEDISGVALSFGQVKALAAGRPELLRQAELTSSVRRLQLSRSVWRQQLNRNQSEAKRLRRFAAECETGLETIEKALAAVADSGDVSEHFAERVITLAKGEANYYDRPRGGWRGLELRADQEYEYGSYSERPKQRAVKVAALAGYRTVFDFVLPAKVIRRGPAAVRSYVAAELEHWLDGIAATTERLRQSKADAEAEAQTFEDFAAVAAFDQEDELIAVEMELMSIEAQLSELANQEATANAA